MALVNPALFFTFYPSLSQNHLNIFSVLFSPIGNVEEGLDVLCPVVDDGVDVQEHVGPDQGRGRCVICNEKQTV